MSEPTECERSTSPSTPKMCTKNHQNNCYELPSIYTDATVDNSNNADTHFANSFIATKTIHLIDNPSCLSSNMKLPIKSSNSPPSSLTETYTSPSSAQLTVKCSKKLRRARTCTSSGLPSTPYASKHATNPRYRESYTRESLGSNGREGSTRVSVLDPNPDANLQDLSYETLSRNLDANLAEIDMDDFRSDDIHQLLVMPSVCGQCQVSYVVEIFIS